MGKAMRETVADWLMALGALLLLGSLFLTWSHQFSRPFLAQYGASSALQGIPHDPNAWQVYSAADVLLAIVAAGLLAVALWGGRTRRIALALTLAVSLVFTAHALGTPPTNGAVIYQPNATPPRYAPNTPIAGAGEDVALLALALGAA
ncbi:MAG TPA: hypothetical protein VIK04_11140, partial [Solirubrobacteraceae bacterium]